MRIAGLLLGSAVGFGLLGPLAYAVDWRGRPKDERRPERRAPSAGRRLVFPARSPERARPHPAHRPPPAPVFGGRIIGAPSGGAGGYRIHYRPAPRREQAPSAALRPQEPRPASNPPRRFSFKAPDLDDKGRRIVERPVQSMARHSRLVQRLVADRAILEAVRAASASEGERDGRFHWSEKNGVRLGHWYDKDHERDWVGFYHEGRQFWTIYWKGHYWWHEPGAGRWLSFWKDRWWWRSPEGQFFVFMGDQYYRWSPASNAVAPSPSEPAEASQTREKEGGVWLDMGTVTSYPSDSSEPTYNYSSDGSRMVQVEGPEHSAYLYDLTQKDEKGGNVLIRYLGSGFTEVAFSDTSRGVPLQIILTEAGAEGKSRRVALDEDGRPFSSSPPGEGGAPAVEYGAPSGPGFDKPGVELPPTDAPMPDDT